jgi:hypothetical protein
MGDIPAQPDTPTDPLQTCMDGDRLPPAFLVGPGTDASGATDEPPFANDPGLVFE